MSVGRNAIRERMVGGPSRFHRESQLRWVLALLLVPIVVAGVVFFLLAPWIPQDGPCTAPVCAVKTPIQEVR